MNESKILPERIGRSVTLIGVSVNVILIAFKFFAGIFGHSHALIADAVHSISDLFTDAVVLLGLRAGRKAPDAEHHFGHARLETLASAFVGAALIATALYLGVAASLNIYHHHDHHPTGLALIGAGLSIALKESLYHYTVYVGRRIKSQLIVANAWHQRSDALSSVAVFVGVTGAILKPSWNFLDSFAAIVMDAVPGNGVMQRIRILHQDAISEVVGDDVIWTDGVSVSALGDPDSALVVAQLGASSIRTDQVARDGVE